MKNVGANSDIHLVLFDEENRAVGFHSKSGDWQVHHMKVLSRVDRYRYRKAMFVGFTPSFGLSNHWTLVVINLTKGAAFWIDHLKNRIDPDVFEVVERSFNIMKKKKPNWMIVKIKDSPRAYTLDDIDYIRFEWVEFAGKHCPLQVGSTECGYYVMEFMREIVNRGSIVISDSIDT
uniref:Ubiquitin-like protease family profile domain-containing protein n=1 Tax=Cucumis melo TaxID=3656 RepID=A0A9I9E733_CUCME